MSIYENILTIYELTTFKDADSRISECLLRNYNKIENMSVKEIASLSSVSKSAVSKFFKHLSERGTYESFMAGISHEKMYYQNDIKRVNQYISMYKTTPVISHDDMNRLIQIINSSNKIVILSSTQYFSDFNVLLKKTIGKTHFRLKFHNSFYNKAVFKEISELEENDLLLLIEPEISLYERYMRTSFEMNYSKLIHSHRGRNIVIQRNGEKVEDVEEMNFIENPSFGPHNYIQNLVIKIIQELNVL